MGTPTHTSLGSGCTNDNSFPRGGPTSECNGRFPRGSDDSFNPEEMFGAMDADAGAPSFLDRAPSLSPKQAHDEEKHWNLAASMRTDCDKFHNRAVAGEEREQPQPEAGADVGKDAPRGRSCSHEHSQSNFFAKGNAS